MKEEPSETSCTFSIAHEEIDEEFDKNKNYEIEEKSYPDLLG